MTTSIAEYVSLSLGPQQQERFHDTSAGLRGRPTGNRKLLGESRHRAARRTEDGWGRVGRVSGLIWFPNRATSELGGAPRIPHDQSHPARTVAQGCRGP